MFGQLKLLRLISTLYFIIFHHILSFVSPNLYASSFSAVYKKESNEFLNNKVLRVAVYNYPPSVIATKEGDGVTFNYKGICIEIINYFSKNFNISYEYVHLNQSDMKKYGYIGAGINMVSKREADIAALGVVALPEVVKRIDVSDPVVMAPYRLIVPWPDEESRILALIRPFQPIVWIYLTITLLFLPLLVTIFSKIYINYLDGNKNSDSNISHCQFVFDINGLVKISLFLLSHLTNHRLYLRFKFRAVTITIGVWCLATIVLANIYGATLLSFLSVAKLESVPNSLDVLASTGKYRLITQSHTRWVNYLMNATSGHEKTIADSFKIDPTNLIATIEEAETKLMTGKYALAYLDVFNLPLIYSTYKKSGNKCRLARVKEPIPHLVPASIGLPKNSPFTKLFNKKVQAQHEAGLIGKYIKDLMPRIDQCTIKNRDTTARQKSLTLFDLSGAFVILCLGNSVSILVFLLELLFKRFKLYYHSSTNNKPDFSYIADIVGAIEIIVVLPVIKEKHNVPPNSKSNVP